MLVKHQRWPLTLIPILVKSGHGSGFRKGRTRKQASEECGMWPGTLRHDVSQVVPNIPSARMLASLISQPASLPG